MKTKLTLEEKYSELLETIKQLEIMKEALITEIVKNMNKQGITNERTDQGQFLLAWRKKWEYSTDTEMLAERLKESKRREENNGTAKIVEQTEYLRFIPLKSTND